MPRVHLSITSSSHTAPWIADSPAWVSGSASRGYRGAHRVEGATHNTEVAAGCCLSHSLHPLAGEEAPKRQVPGAIAPEVLGGEHPRPFAMLPASLPPRRRRERRPSRSPTRPTAAQHAVRAHEHRGRAPWRQRAATRTPRHQPPVHHPMRACVPTTSASASKQEEEERLLLPAAHP